MPNLKLKSSDNEIFEVDMEIAKCSITIRNMLGICGTGDSESVVPLDTINSATLRKVLEWATYHKDDPEPTQDNTNKPKGSDAICGWDQEFLKCDRNVVFEVMTVANFLEIKDLLDMTVVTIANMLKNKTTTEMREIISTED